LFLKIVIDNFSGSQKTDGMSIDWIKEGLKKEGKSKIGLAAAIGRSPSAVTELLKGKRKLQVDEITKIARYLDETPPPFGGVEPERTVIVQVPVRGEAAPDLWRGPTYIYDDSPAHVPIVPGEFAMTDQFAVRVVGNSMDKLKIHSGDYLICVAYSLARDHFQTGDVVIVERQDADRIETTCRELVVAGRGLELWFRSSDPRYQDPIIIVDAETMRSHDGMKVRIVGKVIARYSPM
jgi:SOS-response transcriptional repressor LexA